ncbi:Rgg/GadR/MutR family transcriptional regulator [Streptococcus oricebi]|uniref:MutR family transcriptional regulator n=1 Tax=Streptococcus oricebi TaxID=1547447 RepID=A0ABS5B152_9STRE|nr:Rgg/GadR/MutR family transcriptional regulator [Streptococcus oricebi]MBP2622401.1 MutR family transcriptional regulator [Streptococcus oricebi]
MGNLMELGELYKDLRLARKVKLKDVANEHISISQLSKFENGQSMLSADKLFAAISGIQMSFAEFGHAFNNYEQRDFFKLSQKTGLLRSQQDIAGLKRLLEDYCQEKDRPLLYDQLNQLVIKESIYSLDKDFSIPQEEVDQLTTYLYDIEEWTEYELYLFANTLSLLSDRDLIFLGKTFVERDKLYHALPSHQNTAKMTFLNLIMALIERGLFEQVDYFTKILEASLTFQDMFVASSLNFLKLLVDYVQDANEEKLRTLQDYIQKVEEIGNPILAQHLRLSLEQFINQEVEEK